MAAFDPRQYWESRLAERFGLLGVGYLGMGHGFKPAPG